MKCQLKLKALYLSIINTPQVSYILIISNWWQSIDHYLAILVWCRLSVNPPKHLLCLKRCGIFLPCTESRNPNLTAALLQLRLPYWLCCGPAVSIRPPSPSACCLSWPHLCSFYPLCLQNLPLVHLEKWQSFSPPPESLSCSIRHLGSPHLFIFTLSFVQVIYLPLNSDRTLEVTTSDTRIYSVIFVEYWDKGRDNMREQIRMNR